ncbi:MAG TPA: transcriptional regulator, partial [Dokdonella sp.]|nr:transcriptional regulator [Dokdonella sp.]
DLVPSIGKPHRVYEVLNGKRGLTITMIRNLHRNLGIPAESLIGV